MAKRICRTADEWNRLPQLGTGRSGSSIAGEAMQSHWTPRPSGLSKLDLAIARA